MIGIPKLMFLKVVKSTTYGKAIKSELKRSFEPFNETLLSNSVESDLVSASCFKEVSD